MKFQSVAIILSLGSSIMAIPQPRETIETRSLVGREVAAATCTLLCCRRSSFEGICAKCRDLCPRAGEDEEDEEDE
ncbi:hypothetical protein QQS21_010730 [Conoideocrella luteorostrata]|uniref:Uncharacterized protein n=1 Tax=Conoideocrella luteorostrata TaxID=1105319 RepID=A0AAJ0CEM1_9HYPO|nr:hypothetical protein QQS21_010730 [Conoideocrella luteorostrata]